MPNYDHVIELPTSKRSVARFFAAGHREPLADHVHEMTMPTDRTGEQPHVHEGYFPVPGAQLYFREIGNGPPLVILHGGPDCNHNYLLPDLDRLSIAFHLIYYDQRGRGKSSRGVAPGAVNINSEVDDLDRLRQRVKIT